MFENMFRKKERIAKALEGYAFISPWLLGLVLFQIGPMLFSLAASFTNWNILKAPKFIGLSNYMNIIFNDELSRQSITVTCKYTFFSVIIGLIISLLLAEMLNSRMPGIYLFRTLLYVPSVVSGVALALVWVWILNPDFGLLNYMLSLVGLKGPNWLGDPDYALWSIIMMSVMGVGGPMVIFIAGLQNIPKQLYEAASIDGANKIHSFFNITLPLLSPTILFNLITMIIGSLRTFTQVYIITDGSGGPLNSTLFFALYLYRKAFTFMEMGYASAMAWVLFIVIFILTIIVLRSSSMWVYYESERNE